jgi:protein TonB
MTAGMGRFILLSAALHLLALAALGHGTTQPMKFLPSALSVTFRDGPSDDAVEISRHGNPQAAAPPSLAKNNTKHADHPMPATPAKVAAPDKEHDVSAPSRKLARSETNDGEEDIHANPTMPHPARQNVASITNGKEQGHIAVRVAAAPSPHLDRTLLGSRLEGQLRDALAPYFAYPMLARRNGWQGQVRLDLRVEADGRLSHVRIAHSSGYRLLDRAALSTLNHIKSVPKAAGWLNGRHFDMVLPVDYRLIDGQS